MKETPMLMTGVMVRAYLAGLKGQTRRIVKPQPANLAGPNFDGLWSDTIDPVVRYFACPYGQAGDRIWVKETFLPKWPKEATKSPMNLACIPHYRADGDRDGWKGLWRPSIFMPREFSRISLDVSCVRIERVQEISDEDAWAEGCKRGERTDNGGWFPAEEPHKSGKGLVGWDCARDWYRDLWNEINLEPKALYGRDAAGKKVIVSYQAFPWCEDDFEERFPRAREEKKFRGKPLVVTANPWIWVIEFPKFSGGRLEARTTTEGAR